MYKEVFNTSWKDLKNNPILFLPDFIMMVATLLLGWLFLHFSGITQFLASPDIIAKEIEELMPIVTGFFQENLLKLIIAFSLFILTSFILGSGLLAMKLGMMRDFVSNKKLSLKRMWGNSRHFWDVVYMKILMFLIGIVFFLFFFGSGLILYTMLPRVIAILAAALIFVIVIILLTLILLFRYPILFLDKKNPIAAIKDSLIYFNKNKKHVLFIWLIILAVTIGIKLFEGMISPIIQYKSVFYSIFLLNLIRSLFNLLIGVWSSLFRFKMYKIKGLSEENP